MLLQKTFKYRNIRVSLKRIKPLLRSLVGLNLLQAKYMLNLIYNKPSLIILKLLKNNLFALKTKFNINNKNIYIMNLMSQKGTSLKRFRFSSKGSTKPYKKNSIHLVCTFGIII